MFYGLTSKTYEDTDTIRSGRQIHYPIRNPYPDQRIGVWIQQKVLAEFPVKRGVGLGCILFRLLFNTYSENLFKEALHDSTDAASGNIEIIDNFRYADDTVLLADLAEDLQRIIDLVLMTSEHSELDIISNEMKSNWFLTILPSLLLMTVIFVLPN